jgi:hypothetical protein
MRVSEGTRTPDRLDHNQELYQLSYAHRGTAQSTSVPEIRARNPWRRRAARPVPARRSDPRAPEHLAGVLAGESDPLEGVQSRSDRGGRDRLSAVAVHGDRPPTIAIAPDDAPPVQQPDHKIGYRPGHFDHRVPRQISNASKQRGSRLLIANNESRDRR